MNCCSRSVHACKLLSPSLHAGPRRCLLPRFGPLLLVYTLISASAKAWLGHLDRADVIPVLITTTAINNMNELTSSLSSSPPPLSTLMIMTMSMVSITTTITHIAALA